VKVALMVNKSQKTERQAAELLRQLFREFGDFSVAESQSDRDHDLVMEAAGPETTYRIVVQAKTRVTPQTAIPLCERMQTESSHVIPVLFAPVISPRVAEIAKGYGVGYVDGAGNCFLHSRQPPLLIERRGFKSEHRAPKRIIDPFSPKSSRIVRAMLSEPARGWKVREFSEDPEIDVSTGLASKVKQALVEEGYAVEFDRLLYLRDPVGLLENWSANYPGPAEKLPLYFRDGPREAEAMLSKWCRQNELQCALAGFSAAWRLAPEVRHTLATVYVEERGFDREKLDLLTKFFHGKVVDSGANAQLWRPFDDSVFAHDVPPIEWQHPEVPATSALQTYVDVKQLAGRGEEAATAVYDNLLLPGLTAAARQIEERLHADV
jgi:hypothetical protein